VSTSLAALLGALPGVAIGLLIAYGNALSNLEQIGRGYAPNDPTAVCVPPEWLAFAVYVVAALVTYAGALAAVSAVLRARLDRAAGATLRLLAWTLPVVIPAAICVTVLFAATQGFSTDRTVVAGDFLVPAFTLVASVAGARMHAVRRTAASARPHVAALGEIATLSARAGRREPPRRPEGPGRCAIRHVDCQASRSLGGAVMGRGTRARSLVPVLLVLAAVMPGAARAASSAGETVSVIVRLEGASLATYEGGLRGLPAALPARPGARLDFDSPAARAYARHLAGKRAAVEAAVLRLAPGARVVHRYDTILNGFSVLVPESRIRAIERLPGVLAVHPDELVQPAMDNTNPVIGTSSAGGAWDMGYEGAGQVVAVIDTGVDLDHAALQNPAPDGTAYVPPPEWEDKPCVFGDTAWNPNDAPGGCNGKLLGASVFLDTYIAQGKLLGSEYRSARDASGHGTMTAVNAVGNCCVPAQIFGVLRGQISGVAPEAQLAAYKALGLQGGFPSDIVAAIQQALEDGVDVVNYSVTGGKNPYSDPVEQAFLEAWRAAGIVVVAAAGNDGPGAGTTAHPAPWITTAGASSGPRQFGSDLTLTSDSNMLDVSGTSITEGAGPAPLVDGGQCNSSLTGVASRIVLCEAGTVLPLLQSFVVGAGNGAGMIAYNTGPGQVRPAYNHFVPTVHLGYSKGTQLLEFLSNNSSVAARFTAGAAAPADIDVIARFSGRGGPGIGVIKPDLTAPGVQILSGTTPIPGSGSAGRPGESYQAFSGTSGSSAIVAGAAALLLQKYPTWSPAAIRSALMTTAAPVEEEIEEIVMRPGRQPLGAPDLAPATPFAAGAGRIDVARALDPGLVLDIAADAFPRNERTPWRLNLPSVLIPANGPSRVQRTVQSVLPRLSRWRLVVTGPDDLELRVPARLTVRAGRKATFTIRIDAGEIPDGEVRHATLVLRQLGGPRRLHVPISVVG
jgi:subtilisin family serine protease